MCDWRCFTEIWGAKSWKFFNFPFKNLQGLPIATGSYIHADIVDYLKLSSYQFISEKVNIKLRMYHRKVDVVVLADVSSRFVFALTKG